MTSFRLVFFTPKWVKKYYEIIIQNYYSNMKKKEWVGKWRGDDGRRPAE